ncbi:hypothetical protein VSK91_05355 [Bacillus swezeyi]
MQKSFRLLACVLIGSLFVFHIPSASALDKVYLGSWDLDGDGVKEAVYN